MKRIKIIGVPIMKPITEHLTEFLKTVRKDKVAADLIGDDERSEEFVVNDFDIFGDEPSNGVELTFADTSRIIGGSNKLAKDRAAAAVVTITLTAVRLSSPNPRP